MSSTNVQQRPSEVVRWDPFEDLDQLQQQLARMFPAWGRVADWSHSGTGADREFSPLADVEETDDAYLVEVELPGVDKQDINLEVSGRRLTVAGERKEKERRGTVRRRTRSIGHFRYEIMLPSRVDDTNVEAHLEDGVLTIRILKATEERPKQINIK